MLTATMSSGRSFCAPPMEIKMRAVATSAIVAMGLSCLVSGAVADVVTYHGADNDALSLVSGSEASVAARDWATAVGPSTVIDFEDVAITRSPNNLTVAPGAQLTVTGTTCCGIVSFAGTKTNGFNVTQGGAQYLVLAPTSTDSRAQVVFTFADPINAFSAFLTGTQEHLGGAITIEFDDGTTQSLGVTKNGNTGGLLFVGFTDVGRSFRSVTIATTTAIDTFGIDDVRFAMVSDPAADLPEPGSATLVAAALLGLALSRRRS